MCKHCWDDDEVKVHHKDWIRGYADDGFEETPHRKSSTRKRTGKKPGCPGNDGRSHVYIWQPYDSQWLSGYEIKVCCGCLKRHHGKGGFRRMNKSDTG